MTKNTSELIVHPTNDTITDVVENQYITYKRKGYGIIMASVITFFYFLIFPNYIREFYPTYYSYFSSNEALFIFTTLFVNYTTYFTQNFVWYIIYILKSPFFERYRITPNQPWLWEQDYGRWKKTLVKTLKNQALLQFVIIPIFLLTDVYGSGIKLRTDVKSMPSNWEIIKHVTFAMIVEDFLFYWGHRILHLKSLYPYIHKQHHEYNYPIALSAEYAHPLEFIMANLIPTSAGFLVLGRQGHLISNVIWQILRISETFDGHSGYELSWSPYRLLPLSGSAQYHNYHHSHNDGNFCSFFIFWDTIQGTSQSYYKYLFKKEKEEAQRINQAKKAN